MNLPITLLMVLSFLVSCSKLKKFENQSDEMAKTAHEMKNKAIETYDGLRSGTAEQVRNEKFKILSDPNVGMGTKISAAAVLYMAFEFQLWNHKDNDTDKRREQFFLDAASDYIRRVSDYYETINVKKISPTKLKDSNVRAFYALAAAMHFKSTLQKENAEKASDFRLVSFLDLVKDALLKDFKHEENPNYSLNTNPSYTDVFVSGVNKHMMIDLLRARVDFMAGMALKNLTDPSKMTLKQKVKGLGFTLTGGLIGSLDLPETYELANNSTKMDALVYLNDAFETQSFLKQIGIEKNLEKKLRSAFKNIKLDKESSGQRGQTTGSHGPKTVQDPHKEQIRSLITSLIGK